MVRFFVVFDTREQGVDAFPPRAVAAFVCGRTVLLEQSLPSLG